VLTFNTSTGRRRDFEHLTEQKRAQQIHLKYRLQKDANNSKCATVAHLQRKTSN